MLISKNLKPSDLINMLDPDEIKILAPHFGILKNRPLECLKKYLVNEFNKIPISKIWKLLAITCAPVMNMIIIIKKFLEAINVGIKGTHAFAIGLLNDNVLFNKNISNWQFDKINNLLNIPINIDIQIYNIIRIWMGKFPSVFSEKEEPDYLKRSLQGSIYEDVLGGYESYSEPNYSKSDYQLLKQIVYLLSKLISKSNILGIDVYTQKAYLILQNLIKKIDKYYLKNDPKPKKEILLLYLRIKKIENIAYESLSQSINLKATENWISDFLGMEYWKYRWRIYEIYIMCEILGRFLKAGFKIIPNKYDKNGLWRLKYANAKEFAAIIVKDNSKLFFYYQGRESDVNKEYMPDILIESDNQPIIVCDPKHGISYDKSKIKKVCINYSLHFKSKITAILNYYHKNSYQFDYWKDQNNNINIISSGVYPHSYNLEIFLKKIDILIEERYSIKIRNNGGRMTKLSSIPYILYYINDYEINYECIQCTPAKNYQSILIADNKQKEYEDANLSNYYTFLKNGTIVFYGEGRLWFTSPLRTFIKEGPKCEAFLSEITYDNIIIYKTSNKFYFFDVENDQLLNTIQIDNIRSIYSVKINFDKNKIAYISEDHDLIIISLKDNSKIKLGKAYTNRDFSSDKEGHYWDRLVKRGLCFSSRSYIKSKT